MSDKTLLERNLLALSSKNSLLSYKIGKARTSPSIKVASARNGSSVPIVIKNGRNYPLHSMVNPEREGMKIASLYRQEGYIVFLGFGSGYHIIPFLESPSITHLLIIDKDESIFRSILQKFDLRRLILDPRSYFLISEEPKTIEEHFYSSYIPAVSGDLQTINLRPRIQTESEYFDEIIGLLKECISSVSDDYTVQSYFGKKWYINTLSNLPAAQTTATTLPPIRRALITGAGPSLENQIPKIKEFHESGFLIATDTSFPALKSNGVKPDIVISIDCQQISYMHFLSGFPADIPLVLDLASPPDLTKLTDKLFFFTSGHPLSQYVNTNWRQFPYIDTSGGNVSHAALSLANGLGASEIYLFGMDFSYPEGKSYAVGTYIYPFFRVRENRYQPIENLFFSFLLRNSNIVKENVGSVIRYSTKPMISYKKRLEQSLSRYSAEIHQASGNGLPLQIVRKGKSQHDNERISTLFSAGKPRSHWKTFLQEYIDQLKQLKPLEEPISQYFEGLSPREKDLWVTLFPAAAAFQRGCKGEEKKGAEILRDVYFWSMTVLHHYLQDYE